MHVIVTDAMQEFRVCPTFYNGVFHRAVRLMMLTVMRAPHTVTLTPPSEATCRLP